MAGILIQPDSGGTCCPECLPDPCGSCLEVTLVCDSIAASKTKCGFAASLLLGHLVRNYACGAGDGSPTYSDPVSGNNIYRTAISVATGCECPGSGFTATGEITIGCSFSRPDCTRTNSCSGSISGPGTSICKSTTCSDDVATLHHCLAQFSEFPSACCISLVNTLSDEYTTEELIADTIAALPPYCGVFGCADRGSCTIMGQGCSCAAVLDTNPSETIYTIQRFKYKFTFPAQATGFTINWNEHFVPESGSPVDTPMSESIPAGNTESGVYEVLEPSTDGTITITDVTTTVP